MRHLMSPLDFSVEELDKLLKLANDMRRIRKNTRTPARAKSWPPVFMSPAPGPG